MPNDQQLEASLKEIDDLKAALDEHAIVAITDPQGKITYVNDKFCAISQYSREELIGQDHRIINSGYHSKEFIRDLWVTICNGKVWKNQIKNKAKDGSYYWEDTTIVPFRNQDGKPRQFVAIRADITERKNAEEALKKSEQRFAAIMENMPGFAWIKGSDGRFVYLNQSAAQIALTPSDWHGKTDLELWPPEVAARYIASDQTVLASGEPLHTVEPYPNMDGEVGYVLVSKFPIFDTNGAVIQVGGLGIDITERKHQEELLENSREQLRALTAKLHTVREEEGTRLSRELHDELGHALTGLSMDLAWMGRKFGEEWNPALRSQLQKRMNSMTASLETTIRAVQRIAASLRPGMLDDLGLAAALEWHAEEFEKRTGICCHWTSKAVDMPLSRDRATALFRIFQEILTNVARHAKAHLLKLNLTQSDGQIVLEVLDDGNGFDEKKVADHKSLGLLGMRERAAFVGGQVIIDTHPGKGTKVTVRCPTG